MPNEKPRKTVLITGSSTGIGRQTALLFQKKGWNVIATMRTPEKEKFLHTLTNVLVLPLDVTNNETITNAIQKGIEKFESIDVVINNAGYGATGPFELTPEDNIQRQYDTNVFGPMRVIQAALPHFREKKSGTFVNISSVGGRVTFPLYSLYHGTKWALEGFTESLQYELEQFNIKLKLVEPGAIRTDFYSRSADKVEEADLAPYKEMHDITMPNLMAAGESGITPDKVAQTIYKAAISKSKKLRYPVGNNTGLLLFFRRFMPDRLYYTLVKKATMAHKPTTHNEPKTAPESTKQETEKPKDATQTSDTETENLS